MDNLTNYEWEDIISYQEYKNSLSILLGGASGAKPDETEIQNWISVSNYMGVFAGAIRLWGDKLDDANSLKIGLKKIHISLVFINNGKKDTSVTPSKYRGGFLEAITEMRNGTYPVIKVPPAPVDDWDEEATGSGIKCILKPILSEVIKRIGANASGVFLQIVVAIKEFIKNVDEIL